MNKILDNILKTNLLPLAFIGDSVHTLFIREYCLNNPNLRIEHYHSKASHFCKASSQAISLQYILKFLTQEECEIVRRGRNLKPKHIAKNATTADYSQATAFEVLIGYLYLKNDKKRLEEVLNLSIQALENNK